MLKNQKYDRLFSGHSLRVFLLITWFAMLVEFASGQKDRPLWIDDKGIRNHTLVSPHQKNNTILRVLLPKNIKHDYRYRILFVLPVHESGLFKNGNGLLEVQKLNIHNEHKLICVAPSFSSKPWYADHDLNPNKKDESHLLKTVIPYIEENYPVIKNYKGRLLVGFSKSGWGAISLLLRHPDKFYKAVAWDPGIRIDTGQFENPTEKIHRIRRDFGSNENFEKYRISTLLKTPIKGLGGDPRLFYYNRLGSHRTRGGGVIHNLMIKRGISHKYAVDQKREHRWDSGWLSEAILFLIQ